MAKSIPVVTEEASLPQPILLAAASAVRASASLAAISPVQTAGLLPAHASSSAPASHQGNFRRLLRHFSLAAFALLFLVVGVAAVVVGGSYWSRHVISRNQPRVNEQPIKPTIAGLNLTVPANQLQAKLQTITGQPATVTVGPQVINISPDTIKSWLQITTNKAKTEDYIRIKAGAMAATLNEMAGQFVKTPVNAVTVNEDGIERQVAYGRNGMALTDPNALKAQADLAAKTVMNGNGLKFSTGLTTQPFQSVAPTAFPKLLVVNVSTKKMWAFQNGQQVNSWLISAGKPSTPTPLGQFHVYAKYYVQDMRGFNPDGTPYFQPHVRWIEYFSGGSAIHGVYWHPLSWFGANNSSHGCVGLPESEAAWIYNWAPIGTTVITHA